MRYLRGGVQARKQAVSVTKLATSVASIKIPRRNLTVVCYCSSSAFFVIVGRLILFRCGETFARKLVVRNESRRLENGNTGLRFEALIARRTRSEEHTSELQSLRHLV